LAALFHSLALVSPLRQRSRTSLPARLFHYPVWYGAVRRCCLSLLRLVSCVADRSSAPASAGEHSRANQTEDKRHRIKMQLLAYPSCQRSSQSKQPFQAASALSRRSILPDRLPTQVSAASPFEHSLWVTRR